MRKLVIVAALALLGACSVETGSSHEAANPAGGYDMQISAADDVELFLISGPDGKRAAARVDHGVSSIVDANETRLALGEARAAAADLGPLPEDDHVKISLPGFELSVAGDDHNGDGDHGRAQIAINAGGREVNIDAGAEGENGRALVHVAGASASDARDFINDADDLSTETKQQMLEQLGLAETAH